MAKPAGGLPESALREFYRVTTMAVRKMLADMAKLAGG